MESRWRKIAAPIIARVLKESEGKTEAEIKAALSAAYPFGPREYHPYKIWLKEIRCQRGKKTRRQKTKDAEVEAAMGPGLFEDSL